MEFFCFCLHFMKSFTQYNIYIHLVNSKCSFPFLISFVYKEEEE